jgi:6,7-dimethyl-8-ribityllumazine synthase
MATAYKNLSSYDTNELPDASKMRIGVVVAEWNGNITEKLLTGAVETLEKQHVSADNILVSRVPGTFELTYAAQQISKYGHVDGVIVLGCVVRGETPHFDYVCDGVTQGITQLNATQEIPIVFGILTTENMQQAEDRAGGKYGNKGDESAICVIKMIDFIWKLKK